MQKPKPSHFCADHGFEEIGPDDPRMASCQCDFTPWPKPRLLALSWRVMPWRGLKIGESCLLITNGTAAIWKVIAADPPFESTFLRDAISHYSSVLDDYKSQYRVGELYGSTMSHFLAHVANVLNQRLVEAARYGGQTEQSRGREDRRYSAESIARLPAE